MNNDIVSARLSWKITTLLIAFLVCQASANPGPVDGGIEMPPRSPNGTNVFQHIAFDLESVTRSEATGEIFLLVRATNQHPLRSLAIGLNEPRENTFLVDENGSTCYLRSHPGLDGIPSYGSLRRRGFQPEDIESLNPIRVGESRVFTLHLKPRTYSQQPGRVYRLTSEVVVVNEGEENRFDAAMHNLVIPEIRVAPPSDGAPEDNP